MIGATSGIGRAALKQFTRYTLSPTVYFVGRNASAGKEVEEELKEINGQGRYVFVKEDVSLIRRVDVVCEMVKGEGRLNVLWLSAGFFNWGGREESPEGLDRKFSVNYYSRMRFIHNLLPLLTAASSLNQLSRVLTILSAGRERHVLEADMDLKHHMSIHNCESHVTTFTAFMLEEFAARNPGVSFLHVFPGVVHTNFLSRDQPWITRMGANLLWNIATPWLLGERESGERNLYLMTVGGRLPPRNGSGVGVHLEGEGDEEKLRGTDGVVGSGAYLVNWDGERTGRYDVLEELRSGGLRERVCAHTEEMWGAALGAGT
ncbi:hypothetical protein GP486_001803 [Trichoglossum hirsutum]|uniref:Short-chain dehydrogenase/reductase n=1 Tax=Trichoglossum hirsutum TaxID=265104 RepID=A0A9P8LGF7_9PEZI|nr:hypothetical protein GP486_001803 [Trichoglossum hirsutum]